MSALVFQHVPVADLPEKWRAKLGAAGSATVTVRIEPDSVAPPAGTFVSDDPAFGIWRDREDMANVGAFFRKLRAPRYSREGSRKES